MNSELPYRPNVALIILNEENKIFLGERIDEDGHWQLPQGGAELDYSLEENALREAEEELGASQDKFKIIKKLNARNKYNWGDMPPEFAIDKWQGQDQTFFLIKFLGENSDLNLNNHIPEFQNYQWIEIEKIIEVASPIRVNGYKEAIEEVGLLIS